MTDPQVWRTQGFAGFSQGTCTNAGQNLYISRAGVLQRIHQSDLNGDGYPDLLFCNSQSHWERPPTYVYSNPLPTPATPLELPAEGAWSGAVADLNRDGYEDLVLGMWYNGIRKDLNAVIYFGDAQGLSERRTQQLPAPECTAVAVGDFNGDGRPDLAFASRGHLRLFSQSVLGFEPKRYQDLPLPAHQLAAADLDGDGFADLLVRTKDGGLTIYWGGTDGLSVDRATPVPEKLGAPAAAGGGDEPRDAEHVEEASPLACIVSIGGVSHLFVPEAGRTLLVPVTPRRTLGAPLVLPCTRAMSAAIGDVNGDGYPDLVVACRQPWQGGECSWIFWGGSGGIRIDDPTPLPSQRACDVAIGELTQSGCADIVLCQGHTEESYTAPCLIYPGSRSDPISEPVPLIGHDARRVLLARTTGQEPPQVILVNYYSGERLGRVAPTIYFGGADGFSPQRHQELPGWGAVEAICADLNDDGRVDLLLANASENSIHRDPGSYLLLDQGAGFPAQPSQILPTTRAHGVCCADLNRDGYLDLVFCGFNNPELLVFYGTAAGFDTDNPQRIRLEHEGVLYKEPRWIYLADLNNNGWLDLVVPQIEFDRSFVLWGGPAGFSMEHCQVLSVVRGACARAADLTGNGYLDLVIGGHMPALNEPHDSFVYIYWNGPDGLREDRRTLLPAKTVNAMALADFNRDGALDLFVCSYHGGLERDVDSYIYWNRPGQGFSAADRTRLFTHSASGCVAADFNGDGWVDLAIAYHKVNGNHVGYSAVWWNGPDGFREERVTRLPTTGPHGMTAVAPTNIRDRGPEEYYLSVPYQLPSTARVTAVDWQAQTPGQTWVHAQLRCGSSPEELAAAPWQGAAGADTWYETPGPVAAARSGGWVQYRLALGAPQGAGTPRVHSVDVLFSEVG